MSPIPWLLFSQFPDTPPLTPGHWLRARAGSHDCFWTRRRGHCHHRVRYKSCSRLIAPHRAITNNRSSLTVFLSIIFMTFFFVKRSFILKYDKINYNLMIVVFNSFRFFPVSHRCFSRQRIHNVVINSFRFFPYPYLLTGASSRQRIHNVCQPLLFQECATTFLKHKCSFLTPRHFS